MKDLYLKAAQMIDANSCVPSCTAIYHTSEFYNSHVEYAELFKPKPQTLIESTWGHLWGNLEEQKQCRVLALLFMHWITEHEK